MSLVSFCPGLSATSAFSSRVYLSFTDPDHRSLWHWLWKIKERQAGLWVSISPFLLLSFYHG